MHVSTQLGTFHHVHVQVLPNEVTKTTGGHLLASKQVLTVVLGNAISWEKASVTGIRHQAICIITHAFSHNPIPVG